MSSGVRSPNRPTSSPPRAGAISSATELAVWPTAVALGSRSRPTISGISALIVGLTTASPQPSRATSAIITAAGRTYARIAQITAWARLTTRSNRRLSTRSASRPVSGASSVGGAAAAIRSAATANPPEPRVCNAMTSAVAAR